MKIYFIASQRGRDKFDKYYQKIFAAIQQQGHTLVDDTIIKIPPKEFYDTLAEGGRDANISLYKDNLRHLQAADINIFECSLHSISVGFMINKSLQYQKPTIVLYLEDNIPYFLDGIEDEKLIVKSYTTDNIESVLKAAILEGHYRSDKRFNFFISPDLLTYLNEVAKELKITKSTFIRNLILEHRKKFKVVSR